MYEVLSEIPPEPKSWSRYWYSSVILLILIIIFVLYAVNAYPNLKSKVRLCWGSGGIDYDHKPEVLLAGSLASTPLDSSNPKGTHANLYCLTEYGQSAVPYPVTCSSSGPWQLDQKLNCPCILNMF